MPAAYVQPTVWRVLLRILLSPPATISTAQRADEENEEEYQVEGGASEGGESAGGSGV